MIKLVLLSGFLGAGKTTLMTNILSNFADTKVGLIVNEFGETGVDGPLLARDDVRMTELNNGSIFCSCIKAQFLSSLVDMSKQDISYLFIEPTGLADPSEMEMILESIAHMCETAYDYRGTVCVVDAENFHKLSKALPALTRQVEYCGAAIINKADLVDEERIGQITCLINELNPECEIIVTSHCRCDVRRLVENLSPVDKAAMESSNTSESRLYSLVLKPQGDIPVDALHKFVEDMSVHAYRVKGFLPSRDGVISVNAVGGVVNIEPWTNDAYVLGLVVISAIGISIIGHITAALEGELKGKLLL